jgi:hypothetical protein
MSVNDVFYNRALLESAGLEPPSAVRIYEKLYLRDGQRRTSNLPLSIDDLCRVLEKDLFLVRRHRSLGAGEVAVTLHD